MSKDLPFGVPLAFALNGADVSVSAAPGARLSEVLREGLGAREVKVGCNAGDCGACTVLLDGAPVCSCCVAAQQVEGRRVETLAGLGPGTGEAAPLARAFLRHGAAQCGICTPGMLVAATALLRANPRPTPAEVAEGLAGVLCRCTGYRKIFDAVLDVAGGAPAEGRGGVGEGVARVDGWPKVMGTEVFGDDAPPEGALIVRVIRSPHARARFRLGDLDGFSARHGLAAVLTAADVPGRNLFGTIPAFVDQPVFAKSEVRFRGEAVAAVVGEAAAVAVFGDEDFPVTWEPLAPVQDMAAATAPGATQLHQTRPGNVMTGGHVRRGEPEAALARADVVVEGGFRTRFVEHAYIEPEAGWARMVGDRLEVAACTQAPHMDREGIAGVLGWPEDRIRILPTAVGGGFGAKLDMSLQPFLALAALKTGQPVRMAYTRTESMQSTTKRHPGEMHARLGAMRDGRLCGMLFEGDFDTGAYASWGPTVAVRVPVHASGPYVFDDYEARARGIHTHNPPAGAFRGFGVPQAALLQETLFDQLAEKLGMDALAFRRMNALENGKPTVCGQVFAQGVGIGACLDALGPHWERAKAEAAAANAGGAYLRRGAGLACGWYGCGNTALPNPSTIRAGLTPGGRIVLHQGAVDIGQGSNTVIAQIFAEGLGVPLGAVELLGADTDLTPDAGKTSASRQTFVSGNAALASGRALRAAILRLVNAGEGAEICSVPGGLEIVEGGRVHRPDLSVLAPDDLGYVLRAEESYDPPTKAMDADGQGGAPYALYGYAAHLAEVEVDTGLGTVRVLRITAAHDVGRAINPVLVEGQVQGGVAQGLGMALMEEYIPGRTENLHDYLIPTTGDMPPVETLIVEEPDAHGPFGAKGLGEHALIPTAPAILNAIARATGARLRETPALPHRVLAAIREAGR